MVTQNPSTSHMTAIPFLGPRLSPSRHMTALTCNIETVLNGRPVQLGHCQMDPPCSDPMRPNMISQFVADSSKPLDSHLHCQCTDPKRNNSSLETANFGNVDEMYDWEPTDTCRLSNAKRIQQSILGFIVALGSVLAMFTASTHHNLKTNCGRQECQASSHTLVVDLHYNALLCGRRLIGILGARGMQRVSC